MKIQYYQVSITILFVLFIHTFISGQNPFHNIIKEHISPNGPGVTALVVKGDNVLFKNAFGYADIDDKRELRTDHIFRIGSITKQFTAMAILKLASEGQLSLQDSIQQYFPGFRRKEESIKIENLLNHTSGLGNQRDIPNWDKESSKSDFSRINLIELIKREDLDFRPGLKFQYSNLGYILLTYIIEQVSGMTYAAYLKENYFRPLGMENTEYGHTRVSSIDTVTGYSYYDNKINIASPLNMDIPQGAGGLTSTIDDLYKWHKSVFFNGEIKKYVGKAHETGMLLDGQKIGYGYGWQIGEVRGRKSIKHDGIINGFTSYQLYIPSEKVYVVLLSNCDCTSNIAELGSEIAAFAFDDPYEVEEKSQTRAEILKYSGKYSNSNGDVMIINVQDGRLIFYPKGGSKNMLLPLGGQEFAVGNSLNRMKFHKNEKDENYKYTYSSLDLPEEWVKTGKVEVFESIETSERELNSYCGKYQFPNAFVLKIEMQDGRLIGLVGEDRKHLLKYGKHSFFTEENDIRLVFTTDEAELVNGVRLIQNREMEAKKIE